MPETTDPPSDDRARWRALVLLSTATLLAMGLWFSASAVVPQLAALHGLTDGHQAWLTMSVQIGFVAGALLSAVLNLADRIAAHHLLALCAAGGAVANATIAFVDPSTAGGVGTILTLRFLTGAALAGVYPPGMKIMASWFTAGRGLALGVLIGAITVGSAGPHLLAAVQAAGGDGAIDWRRVVLVASVAAALGSVVAALFVRSGPGLAQARRFHWKHAAVIVTDPAVRRANFGYLGHMWELYAMWTWVPLCILASYEAAGHGALAGRIAGFSVIAIGGIGCIVAGRLADRRGRTLIASAALLLSGSCALVAGFTVAHPVLLTVVCLVWGIAVVADSAQFSTAVSELCDPRYVGTALTMQTCSGFLLTMVTIRLLTPLQERAGWVVAFGVLALGPVFGIAGMWRLRGMPEALKMASGRR